MNWLSDLTPPGIKKLLKKNDDGGDGLWVRCESCEEMIFNKDLEAAQHVCPSCGHHRKIAAKERLNHLYDGGHWDKIALPEVPSDPLKFKDVKKYSDRLRENRKKTSEQDALIIASGKIDGVQTICAVQNFAFMGGSMGMGLGEGLIKAAETAIEKKAPLVVFSASGGARMQEGILSLMQMPRTTIAVQMVKEAGLPYVVVLTHPTTGGVTASYAMLGDIHLAEPDALIGFAGPRVIEQTIREKLPEGFQRSEYLYEKGMVDMVVHRHEMKATLSKLLRVLTKYGVKQNEALQSAEVVPLTATSNTPEGNSSEASDATVAENTEITDKAAE